MSVFDTLNEKQRATAQKVLAAADKYGVPRSLAFGMAMQESGFDQSKHSKTGPTGVMMLGQKAAKDMGVDRFNEDQNIDGGMRYARQLLDQHNGDWDKTLVAYHDGPNSAYFKGGEMSPAARNHIEKVKGYADMAGDKSAFNTDVEDVEPIDLSGLENSGSDSGSFELRSPNEKDIAFGIAGGVAGAAINPSNVVLKSQISKINKQNQAAERRHAETLADLTRQDRSAIMDYRHQVEQVKQANAAAMQQHREELQRIDQQNREALNLRKNAMDQAAAAKRAAELASAQPKPFGQDVNNWVRGQFGGDIPSVIGNKPLDQGEAQQLGKQGVANYRKAEQVGGPNFGPDPNTGLWLTSEYRTAPQTAPVVPEPTFPIPKQNPRPSAPQPMPYPAPPKPLERPAAPVATPVPDLHERPKISGLAHGIGGAVAGEQAHAAADAWSEGDYLRSALNALTSAGSGLATFSSNPKYKTYGTIAATIGGAANLLKDYVTNRMYPDQSSSGQ